ncbi:ATP-binding protein [Streptomyces sp. NPDC059104]|uniref:ATP-binding protein n=1 Tax=Streptomyces sp. NPDC059104 TaxID=3346729 RepID=UPI0036A2D705
MCLHHPRDRRTRTARRLRHARMLVVLESCDRPAQQARRLLAGQLARLGLLPSTDCPERRRADDALLVASELVTNACRHTSGPTRLTSCWYPEDQSFTISVFDPSPDLPRPAPEAERGEHGGYGIHLVERLSDRWCVVSAPGAGGKTVSATVTFPAAPRRSAGRQGGPVGGSGG